MTKQINVNVEEKDVKQFQQLYRGMLSEYVRKAIKIAITNKQNFIQIMYGGN